MPLASSREASLKRAERIKAERKKPERRNSFSLPSTIDSSTVATEEKARRRQSIRRQSLASLKAEHEKRRQEQRPSARSKENLPPKYSPPHTRSASKKAARDASPIGGIGVVLNFSPPNQVENTRLEREQLQRKETARNRRIEAARAAGQLLVFSPSSLDAVPMEMEPNYDNVHSPAGDPRGQHVSIPRISSSTESRAQTDTSNLTESHAPEGTVLPPRIAEMLERMDGRLGDLVSSGKQTSFREELQTQALRAETLATANQKLEERSTTLEAKVHELSESHAADKESFLVEKTRLEIQWQAAQEATANATSELENVRSVLEEQLSELKDDKQHLKEKVIRLEADLQATNERLAETKSLLDAVRSDNASEKYSLAAKYERLEGINSDLNTQLNESKEARLGLERQMDSLNHSIIDLQTELAASTEELKHARALIGQKEHDSEKIVAEKTELEAIVHELKNDIEDLRRVNEDERVNFRNLNEDSSKAFDKMTQSLADKDRTIGDLYKQLGEMKQVIEKERAEMINAIAKVEASNENLVAESAELSRALADAMEEVKEVEIAQNSLKEKLVEAKNTAKARNNEIENLKQELHEQHETHTRELEEVCLELERSDKDCQLLQEQLSATKNLLDNATSAHAAAQAQVTETLSEMKLSLMDERRLREAAESRTRELDRIVQSTASERDSAHANMQGFTEREQNLYQKLVEGDRIRRELHGRLMQLMGNIRVYVRVRPALLGEKETEEQRAAAENRDAEDGKKRKRGDDQEEVEEPFSFPGVYSRASKKAHRMAPGFDDATKNIIEIREPRKDRGGLKDRRKTWSYGFDKVFTPQENQEDVWVATEPLVQCAVDGFNVTILAYGQTGSGKTFTMLGEPGNEGIISRSVKKLFESKTEIEGLSRGENQVSLAVELLEVYNEKVRDLLAPKSGPNHQEMNLKVTSHEVVGNAIVEVSTEEEVMQILELAQGRRCVKATASNSESSRSHMLFTIHFQVVSKDGVTQKGKLNVCDLAGSERLGKSGTNIVGGALLEETKHINKSLSVLSNVIERLQAGDPNVPFRESKLTFLLKDSLSGNSKTLAIVCCNPLPANVSESVSSLRFAAKVNRVDLKAVANVSC